MLSIYTIKRKTTDEYYRGGYPLRGKNRWSKDFKRAKLYQEERFAKVARKGFCSEKDELNEEFFEIETWWLTKEE